MGELVPPAETALDEEEEPVVEEDEDFDPEVAEEDAMAELRAAFGEEAPAQEAATGKADGKAKLPKEPPLSKKRGAGSLPSLDSPPTKKAKATGGPTPGRAPARPPPAEEEEDFDDEGTFDGVGTHVPP